jgi:hypothetical protein
MQPFFTFSSALCQRTRRTWRKLANCIALFFIALCATNTPASPCIDNETLQNMAQRSGNDTGTLIYVWSPRMVLSLTQAHLASLAAQQSGLDFLPLHDARLPRSEIEQALQAAQRDHAVSARALQGSQALCASDLINTDALRHFPSAFVLTARGTHQKPIVGAMPQAAWRELIGERLKP